MRGGGGVRNLTECETNHKLNIFLPRALAKRTAKDTGKEVVKEAEKKYITDGKQ